MLAILPAAIRFGFGPALNLDVYIKSRKVANFSNIPHCNLSITTDYSPVFFWRNTRHHIALGYVAAQSHLEKFKPLFFGHGILHYAKRTSAGTVCRQPTAPSERISLDRPKVPPRWR